MKRAIYYRRSEHTPWQRLFLVHSHVRAQALMKEHAEQVQVGRLCFGAFEQTPDTAWSLANLGRHAIFIKGPAKAFLADRWKTICMSGRKQWVKANPQQQKLFK